MTRLLAFLAGLAFVTAFAPAGAAPLPDGLPIPCLRLRLQASAFEDPRCGGRGGGGGSGSAKSPAGVASGAQLGGACSGLSADGFCSSNELYALGEICEHIHYQGTCKYYYATAPCNDQGTVVWEVSYVGDEMNDRVSSVRGLGKCWVWLYEHAEGEGRKSLCDAPCPDLVSAGFNDITSSLLFY